jgi:hypothetical protein
MCKGFALALAACLTEGISIDGSKLRRMGAQSRSATGVYTVRFTHRGRRQHRSTGVRDLAGAKVEASRIYAETISGRRLQNRPRDLKALDVLFAEWLTQVESEIAPEGPSGSR